MLFVTKTCPNCRVVKSMLSAKGIVCEIIDAEDNAELAKSFGIKQAPTLIVENNGNFSAFSGIAGVKEYLADSCAG